MYQVGDKLRVVDNTKVLLGTECFDNGDITEIERIEAGVNGIVICVTDLKQGGFPLAMLSWQADKAFVKVESQNEEEIKLTKKVVVAKVDSAGKEIEQAQTFREGDVFDVIDKNNPKNLIVAMVGEQLKQSGDFEQATLVDFGDGMLVFFEQETENAWGLHDYFEIKEVS